MELVNLRLQESAHILPDCIRNVKTFRPPYERSLVDSVLLHREAEGESHAEGVFVLVAIRGAHSHAPSDVLLEVVPVVLLEEFLNFQRQEREQLLRRLCDHEFSGDCHFAEGEIEGAVAIEPN